MKQRVAKVILELKFIFRIKIFLEIGPGLYAVPKKSWY